VGTVAPSCAYRPAGLRLAAISLAGHPDPERFVRDFSGTDRAVAEYLLAEMLERQPGDVQHLLLRTSLLDRVNGELADLLTGGPRPGSASMARWSRPSGTPRRRATGRMRPGCWPTTRSA
jgi:hypothetical protein